MRTLLKVLFGFLAAVVILIVSTVSWFFFYSGDLPDVERLAYFSPLKHPDRALKRRNDVIDAMLRAGSITPSAAESAKVSALGLAL